MGRRLWTPANRRDSVFKTASIEGAALSSATIRFAALWSTRPMIPVALHGIWRIELRPSGYFPDWKLKGLA